MGLIKVLDAEIGALCVGNLRGCWQSLMCTHKVDPKADEDLAHIDWLTTSLALTNSCGICKSICVWSIRSAGAEIGAAVCAVNVTK
jgi:hypothetical protein